MKEKTEQAIVEMYRQLVTQHINSNKKRMQAKEAVKRVGKRYGYSRARVYQFVKQHAPDLLNTSRPSEKSRLDEIRRN